MVSMSLLVLPLPRQACLCRCWWVSLTSNYHKSKSKSWCDDQNKGKGNATKKECCETDATVSWKLMVHKWNENHMKQRRVAFLASTVVRTSSICGKCELTLATDQAKGGEKERGRPLGMWVAKLSLSISVHFLSCPPSMIIFSLHSSSSPSYSHSN